MTFRNEVTLLNNAVMSLVLTWLMVIGLWLMVNGLWLMVNGLWLAFDPVVSGLAELTGWVILGFLGLPPNLPLTLASVCF